MIEITTGRERRRRYSADHKPWSVVSAGFASDVTYIYRRPIATSPQGIALCGEGATRPGVILLLNAVCVHEATHAALLWSIMRKIPTLIIVRLAQAEPDAQCRCVLGWPRDSDEGQQYAAYFEAGRIGVGRALQLGCLPHDADPLRGYSIPAGTASDAYKIELIRQKYGDHCINAGRSLAEREVSSMWPKIIRLATALEEKGTLDEAEIRAVLT